MRPSEPRCMLHSLHDAVGLGSAAGREAGGMTAKTNPLRLAAVAAAVGAALVLVTATPEKTRAAATSPALDAWSKVEKVTGTVTYKFDTELTDPDGGFVSGHDAVTVPMTLNRGTSS